MIRRISVQVKTTSDPGAGTDGYVYLGIGGREYRLDIKGNDDFEPGDDVVYVFGEDANVQHADENDPRTSHIQHLEEFDRYPTYLRLLPKGIGDSWALGDAHVRVLDETGATREWRGIGEDRTMWLGWPFGLTCHLRPV